MKGFTLLELVVSIAIIAVLSSIGIATYQGIQTNNRDQTRHRALTNLKQALELYRHDLHYYPASINELVPKYIEAIPVDPTSSTRSYLYRALDSSGVVCNPSGTSCVRFMLCAAGEGSHNFGDPGNCATNNCGTVRCNMSIINQ